MCYASPIYGRAHEHKRTDGSVTQADRWQPQLCGLCKLGLSDEAAETYESVEPPSFAHQAICDLCALDEKARRAKEKASGRSKRKPSDVVTGVKAYPILGVRYHCIECKIDLCHTHSGVRKIPESLSGSYTHTSDHTLYMFYDDTNAVVQEEHQQFCASCTARPIKGNLYKCQDDMCPDFHLCETCYNLADTKKHRYLHNIERVAGTGHRSTDEGIEEREEEDVHLDECYKEIRDDERDGFWDVLKRAYHHDKCMHDTTDATHWCAYWGQLNQLDTVCKMVAFQHIQERIDNLEVELSKDTVDNQDDDPSAGAGEIARVKQLELEAIKHVITELESKILDVPSPRLFAELYVGKAAIEDLPDSLKALLNMTNENKQDLLMLAAVEGNWKVVKHLTELDYFDAYKTDLFGMSALDYASQRGHINTVHEVASVALKGRGLLPWTTREDVAMSRPLALSCDYRLGKWEQVAEHLAGKTYNMFDRSLIEVQVDDKPTSDQVAAAGLVLLPDADAGNSIDAILSEDPATFFRAKRPTNVNVLLELKAPEGETFEICEIMASRPAKGGTREDEERLIRWLSVRLQLR